MMDICHDLSRHAHATQLHDVVSKTRTSSVDSMAAHSLDAGKRVPVGDGHARVYAFDEISEAGDEEDHIAIARIAVRRRKTHKGQRCQRTACDYAASTLPYHQWICGRFDALRLSLCDEIFYFTLARKHWCGILHRRIRSITKETISQRQIPFRDNQIHADP